MSRQHRVVAARTVVVIVPLAIYQMLCQFEVLDPFSWVSISSAVDRCWQLVTDVSFLSDTLWPTVRTILLSTAVSVVAGVVAGALLWRFPLAYRTVNPYLTLYYSVPAFAFYPVLLSLVGQGRPALVLLASLLGFAAMTANAVIGLRSTSAIHIKLGQALGLGVWRRLRYIYFPTAVPQILVGVRLSVAYAIIGVVGGEFLSGTNGLGYYIQFSYDSFKLVDTYAGVLVVVLMGLVLNAVLQLVSRVLYPTEGMGS